MGVYFKVTVSEAVSVIHLCKFERKSSLTFIQMACQYHPVQTITLITVEQQAFPKESCQTVSLQESIRVSMIDSQLKRIVVRLTAAQGSHIRLISLMEVWEIGLLRSQRHLFTAKAVAYQEESLWWAYTTRIIIMWFKGIIVQQLNKLSL